MHRIATLSAITLLLASGAAWAGCDYPDEPTAPNAEEMTKDEMLAAIAAFREFQSALEDYRTCLEDDFESLDEESQTDERKELFVRRYDGSVDREKKLADEMNEQIRVFNEKNKKEE